MRLLTILILAPLILQACVTNDVIRTVEVPVPVYVTVQSEKPAPPELAELDWGALGDPITYFTLTPEEFDKYAKNLVSTETYILLLQEGWTYYERASSDPSKLGTSELGTN